MFFAFPSGTYMTQLPAQRRFWALRLNKAHGYDAVDGAVVLASSEQEARRFLQERSYGEEVPQPDVFHLSSSGESGPHMRDLSVPVAVPKPGQPQVWLDPALSVCVELVPENFQQDQLPCALLVDFHYG